MAYLLSPLFVNIARRYNFFDRPAGIKAHAQPTPFIGGVLVFVSFWSVIFAGIFLAHFLAHRRHDLGASLEMLEGIIFLTPKIFWIFVGSAVMLGVGFLDDQEHWTPMQKLSGQVVAVLILMSQGLSINLADALGIPGYIFTFIWVLLIVNAFNFIDSLDGHCTGIAIISAIMLFWITQIIHQTLTAMFLVAFMGALLGFFPKNFKPAKIFLGDNGSLFIGYMMAAFTLLCRYYTPKATYATAFIPVLIFGVPIYDTVSVIAVRLFRGVPPWTGDRNHFAHRLVKMGMGDRAAVVFSYLIAITIGHIAVLLTQVNWFGAILIGIIFFFMITIIALLEYYAARRLRIAEEIAAGLERNKKG